MWSRVLAIAGAAAAACSFTSGKAPGSGDGGGGSDGSVPDAGPCMALGVTCSGDGVTLEDCANLGALPTPTPCSWGCVGSGGAHCGVIDPVGAGVASGDATPGTLGQYMAITIGSGATINSDDGTITDVTAGYNHNTRNGVTYFQFKQLTISGAVALAGSNAIALVSDGPISVDGVIDARGPCTSANLTTGGAAGPGGFPGGAQETSATGSGAGITGGNGQNTKGGGGGGYGSAGGDGGSNAPSGGSAFGTALIVQLVGGGGGGGGGGGNGHSPPGGGGGGGIQLVSNTSITITANGGINAGGCGGFSADQSDSAAGGGAGGTILLEAPQITQQGPLAVNGGGGGGANTGGSELGSNRGEDGRLDRTPAAGHAGTGSGGSGGAAITMTGNTGLTGTHSGGGGGGVGRIRFNTRLGKATLVYDNSMQSPGLDDNPTSCTEGQARVD